jgi:hypothetical protein
MNREMHGYDGSHQRHGHKQQEQRDHSEKVGDDAGAHGIRK